MRLLQISRAVAFTIFLFLIVSALFPLPPAKPYSLLVQDKNGEFLQSFLTSDGMWRLQTSPEEIPPKLKRILIQREDQFFYYHPGVNPFAIVRALFQNLTNGQTISGASTITMQVARMLDRKEPDYAT